MNDNRAQQSRNVVGRDQAGRDIVHNEYVFEASESTPMRHFIQKLKREREGDLRFSETLDVLNRYIMPASGETVDGLEAKLMASGRAGLLVFAARAKETFTKTLVANQFSEAAQEILAYLLAEVYTRFHNHVVPLIGRGGSTEDVAQLVQKCVLDEIQRLLEENPLRLFPEEISGMLYYLTGNCHIKWVY